MTTSTTGGGDEASSAQVARLQAELTRAQKRAAESAQALLDSSHAVKKLQAQCSKNEDEIDEWRDRLDKSERRVQFLDDQASRLTLVWV